VKSKGLGTGIEIATAGGGRSTPLRWKWWAAFSSMRRATSFRPFRACTRASRPYRSARKRCTSGRRGLDSDGRASHTRIRADATSRRSVHSEGSLLSAHIPEACTYLRLPSSRSHLGRPSPLFLPGPVEHRDQLRAASECLRAARQLHLIVLQLPRIPLAPHHPGFVTASCACAQGVQGRPLMLGAPWRLRLLQALGCCRAVCCHTEAGTRVSPSSAIDQPGRPDLGLAVCALLEPGKLMSRFLREGLDWMKTFGRVVESHPETRSGAARSASVPVEHRVELRAPLAFAKRRSSAPTRSSTARASF
jgi:hypothetical protein